MSPGESVARQALRESVRVQRESGELPKPEVWLSEETVQYVAECVARAVAPAVAAAVAEAVPAAVTAGIDASLTAEKAEKVFAVGWRTLRTQAKLGAGGWLLGGVSTAFKRLAWVAVIVIGLWMAFGWQGLVAGWKALSSGGHP